MPSVSFRIEYYRKAMKNYIESRENYGNVLFLENGSLKVGVPLNFGIRISHLYYKDSENIFFEQPLTMTALTTPDGWRVRGGHRLWVAPEGDWCYHPDNDPISYELTASGVILRQKNDPRLNLEKTVEIVFRSEDSIEVIHKIKNTADTEKRCALWGVTSVAPLGVEYIPLTVSEPSSAPVNKITTWYYTSLGDERAEYTREAITLTHKPTGELFKIGVGHPSGNIRYENRGVIFEKEYKIDPDGEYTDGEVSYETYMCDHMVELETLSPLYTVEPGGTAEYSEIWKLHN